MADLIAAGGLARSPHINDRSVIQRAKQHLGDSEAELRWASGETTKNQLAHCDMDEYLATPYVQYLSQQFVDQ
ncbi:hypothetical protein ACS2Q0_34700, partial [Bacillus cereus group sp. Bce010]|uniref:hypothetical protein n=1 Tax=Bacillus cereus group sp. Bce010 TaxID=3445251 RepID=UPI003F25271C